MNLDQPLSLPVTHASTRTASAVALPAPAETTASRFCSSPFTTLPTDCSESDDLVEALRSLGYAVQERPRGLFVHGWCGSSEPVEILIETGVPDHDLGFRRGRNGYFKCVADSMALIEAGFDLDGFLAELHDEVAVQDQAVVRF